MDSGINSQFMMQSISAKVNFVDIQDHYSFNEDLICKYSLINYEIQEGDRIGMFKLGWNYVKEYIVFEWAHEDCMENFVSFNKTSLPKDTQEIFQFCFISNQNNILGASEPFQFCDKSKNYQSHFVKEINLLDSSKLMTNNFSSHSQNLTNMDNRLEMQKIKEENNFLRNTLKAIVSEKIKDYDPDIQNLKKITCELQKSLFVQQVQIKDLQVKLENVRLENRVLENDNKTLQRNYTALKSKKEKIHSVKYPLDFDLGELQSLPPFPFAK